MNKCSEHQKELHDCIIESQLAAKDAEIERLKTEVNNYQGMLADLQLSLRNQVELAEERGMRILSADARIARLEEALKDLLNVIELGYAIQPMVDQAKEALAGEKP